MLRRRVARLGLWPVLGQLAFMGLILPTLKRSARGRIAEILATNHLSGLPFEEGVVRVASANDSTACAMLGQLAPRVVVVNGTRILTPSTLQATAAPFLNLHAGITPWYRGVHGGYWALAEGRPDRAGVTLHYLDAGIDTGPIIAQQAIAPSPADSFVTYPYLQLAAGVELLIPAIRALLAGRPVPGRREDPTGTLPRSHPTAWQYTRARLARGVR